MKFILATKIKMTQVFKEDGTVVPVTKLLAGPCVVTQVRSNKKNGTKAVQIGFGTQKKFRISKPVLGHLHDIKVGNDDTVTLRVMRDFKIDENQDLKRGEHFNVSIFKTGEKVQIVGKSKGRGFQGVVKRHHFKGKSTSHGVKDQTRMPGSIGAGGVQRVFKDKRMAGHMGDARVTVKNLEVMEVHPENNELWVKGAVPGAYGGLLLVSTDGDLIIESIKEVVAEPVIEEVVVVAEPVIEEKNNDKKEEIAS